MKKNKAQKDILYISISSFVLVALWIASNLYHAYATSTITPELQQQIEPIPGSFDNETIQKLKTRENIIPVYELNTASTGAVLTPVPTTQETPISSGSASPQTLVNPLETP